MQVRGNLSHPLTTCNKTITFKKIRRTKKKNSLSCHSLMRMIWRSTMTILWGSLRISIRSVRKSQTTPNYWATPGWRSAQTSRQRSKRRNASSVRNAFSGKRWQLCSMRRNWAHGKPSTSHSLNITRSSLKGRTWSRRPACWTSKMKSLRHSWISICKRVSIMSCMYHPHR